MIKWWHEKGKPALSIIWEIEVAQRNWLLDCTQAGKRAGHDSKCRKSNAGGRCREVSNVLEYRMCQREICLHQCFRSQILPTSCQVQVPTFFQGRDRQSSWSAGLFLPLAWPWHLSVFYLWCGSPVASSSYGASSHWSVSPLVLSCCWN